MPKLILFNKPYNVLCQFTDNDNRPTLANYIKEKNFYAAGRLDKDSEGLVLLTDDGKLQSKITEPKYKLEKIYNVQVEGEIAETEISQLCKGVKLKDGITKPAKARKIDEPPYLWPREPPIRKRTNIPTSWLELKITEGRNRQVRRMTAAVNHPTLRLIRVQIGDWELGVLLPGESRIVHS
jgi:23S rRNA pseudouridine2457 synthase